MSNTTNDEEILLTSEQLEKLGQLHRLTKQLTRETKTTNTTRNTSTLRDRDSFSDKRPTFRNNKSTVITHEFKDHYRLILTKNGLID